LGFIILPYFPKLVILSKPSSFLRFLLYRISNAGIRPGVDIREINRLQTMNGFYCICCLLALSYCTYYIFLNLNILAFGIVLLGGFLSALVIFMNAKEQYISANILGVITTGSLVFAISISEGLSGGFWLYYLVTPLMTLSFFGTFKTRISFGSLLFYTVLFLFLILCYSNGYTDESNLGKYKSMIFANFFVTLSFIFFSPTISKTYPTKPTAILKIKIKICRLKIPKFRI
jgi:hypothetical protein